jgi:hypothetical protein
MELLVDAREMQPPEPFERTMEALEQMGPEDEVVLWLFRRPEPLFKTLQRNGYIYTEASGPEGCNEFRIKLPPKV